MAYVGAGSCCWVSYHDSIRTPIIAHRRDGFSHLDRDIWIPLQVISQRTCQRFEPIMKPYRLGIKILRRQIKHPLLKKHILHQLIVHLSHASMRHGLISPRHQQIWPRSTSHAQVINIPSINPMNPRRHDLVHHTLPQSVREVVTHRHIPLSLKDFSGIRRILRAEEVEERRDHVSEQRLGEQREDVADRLERLERRSKRLEFQTRQRDQVIRIINIPRHRRILAREFDHVLELERTNLSPQVKSVSALNLSPPLLLFSRATHHFKKQQIIPPRQRSTSRLGLHHPRRPLKMHRARPAVLRVDFHLLGVNPPAEPVARLIQRYLCAIRQHAREVPCRGETRQAAAEDGDGLGGLDGVRDGVAASTGSGVVQIGGTQRREDKGITPAKRGSKSTAARRVRAGA